MGRRLLGPFIAAALVMCGLGPAACGPPSYELSVAVWPVGGGDVSPGGGVYEDGTELTLLASPAQGYRFDHWEGDASGASPNLSLLMSGDKEVIAHFVAVCTVSTFASPAGGGTVSPAGGTYDCGTEVTLVAAPDGCYSFDRWGDDAGSRSPSLTITLDSDTDIGAHFAKKEYSLSMVASPPGSGTVGPGNDTYECGAEVILTAGAALGYRFDRWEGDVSGLLPATSVIIDGDKTTTAYFRRAYTLTTLATPAKGGTVSPSSGVYDPAAEVTLTATAAFPYAFIGWSGAGSSQANPVTLVMNSDRSVVASFEEGRPYPGVSLEDRKLTGQRVVVPWQLRAGDWVDGQIYVQQHFIKARIVAPTGEVVQEIPQTRAAAFRFQAEVSGTYSLVIYETPGRTLTDYYTLKYSIYTARVS